MNLAGLDNPRPQPNWRGLWLLNLYRLALGTIWLLLPLLGWGQDLLGSTRPTLFYWTLMSYLGLGVLSILTIRARIPAYEIQVVGQVLADIGLITVLLHSSGGATTGLGTLLVVAVAEGALLSAGRMALLFAAFASLGALAEPVLRQLIEGNSTAASYTQAGLLGAACFATALLAQTLARRMRESAELAARRGLDLANLTELNQFIVQQLRAGIIAVDNDCKVRLMNNAAKAMLGLRDYLEETPLEALSTNLATYLQSRRGLQKVQPASLRLTNEGPELLVRLRRLGESPNAGTLIMLEDAGELSAQVQRQKLASLGQLTASIAHEIRNPLGAISHAAQLLLEAPGTPPELERLPGIIHKQSARVNKVVETILQLARREASRPVELALGPWLNAFLEDYRIIHNLKAEQTPLVTDTECTVCLDPQHLRQILTNLCDNALIHAPPTHGEIRFEMHIHREHPDAECRLEIIDHGPGVRQEHATRLFEPFFTSRTTGTGLGLYLARELSELNNASLEYLSREQGGSCFRLTFLQTRTDRI